MGFLFILLFSAYTAFRSPLVQTKLTQFLAKEFSKIIHAKVEIKGVDIELINKVVLEGLYVEDQHRDTLAYIAKLKAGLYSIDLTNHFISGQKVKIEDLKFYLRHYKNEEDLNLQFIIDALASKDTTTDTTRTPRWVFNFDGLSIKNGAFKFNDFRKERYSPGMEFTFLDIKNIQLDFDHVKIEGDTINAHINQLQAMDKCGFNLQHFAGEASVSPRFVHVKNLEIKTPFSDLDLDLEFNYREWNDWEDFEDSVKMNAQIRPSHVNFIDIGFFARPLFRLDIPLDITGKIKGPVSNLKAKKLDVRFGSNTHIAGNFDISGLPDIDQTFFTLDFSTLTSNYSDVTSIPIPPYSENKFIPVPEIFNKLGLLQFNGNFTGFYYDFVAYGNFQTAIGRVETDISMKNVANPDLCTYSGKVFTEGFQLGVLTENENLLGAVTANVTANGKGLTSQSLDAKIQGNVGELNFNKYTYQDLDLDGTFIKKTFQGRVISHDNNLKMVFNGKMNFTDSLPAFDFHADLEKANLDKINLFKIDSNICVSGIIDVNFTGNNIDNAIGSATIAKLRYSQQKDSTFVKNIKLKIEKFNQLKTITLQSDVADANLQGDFKFADIPEAVNGLLFKYLPRYSSTFELLKYPLNLNADLQLKDTRLLEIMFAPNLHLVKEASISAKYNSQSGTFLINGNIPSLKINKNYFQNIRVDGKNSGNSLDLNVESDRFVFGDSVWVDNISLKTLTHKDSLDFDLSWKNTDSVKNQGSIRGICAFNDGRKIKLDLHSSEIYLVDSLWNISPFSKIEIDTNTIHFNRLQFKSRDQELVVNGTISHNKNDMLTLTIKDFELSNLNALTKNAGIALLGKINGRADIADVYDDLIVTSNIKVNKLNLNKELVGDGDIKSIYDLVNKAVRIDAGFTRDDYKTLSVNGYYYPEREENALNFDVLLEKLPLKVAQPFTKGIVSNLGGTATGMIHFGGTFEKIQTQGTVKFNHAVATIDYLNTTYTFDHSVKLTPEAIEINELKLLDGEKNEGIVNGKVYHHHFSKIEFELNLKAKKLIALNTNGLQNNMYFGKAYVTGLLKMRGDPKNILFEAGLKTEKGTQFNIPLGGTSEVGTIDFVRFVSKKEKNINQKKATKIDATGISVNLNLDVTTDAEVKIIFDEKVGDIITGRGTGNIELGINTKGNFEMFGEFTIESGGYLFTLQNLINKQFVIEKAGTIKWSGNPFDADLNLVANYPTKASVYDLLLDPQYQTSSYKIDCKMLMTGRLMNPTINFDIDLPNATADIRRNVENAIPAEDKNKQVFGLLVLNRFFPSSTSANVSGSNSVIGAGNQGTSNASSLANSTSELLSSQLSNMLSQISKDFDVGVKYRPGDPLTSQELEVLFSTQIFNNRISIDGALGYKQNNSGASSSQTNILGDINVEYKITSDGRFRAKAFNKTNDVNLVNSNAAPYTQGIGISVRREFDTLGELFKIFLKKKQTANNPT
ncbi:MAG: translocation/assembly module TamB [Bacteroidia bacterium]|nr:translocation/assembly module TamB [Bacteroidia bacterium]